MVTVSGTVLIHGWCSKIFLDDKLNDIYQVNFNGSQFLLVSDFLLQIEKSNFKLLKEFFICMVEL